MGWKPEPFGLPSLNTESRRGGPGSLGAQRGGLFADLRRTPLGELAKPAWFVRGAAMGSGSPDFGGPSVRGGARANPPVLERPSCTGASRAARECVQPAGEIDGWGTPVFRVLWRLSPSPCRPRESGCGPGRVEGRSGRDLHRQHSPCFPPSLRGGIHVHLDKFCHSSLTLPHASDHIVRMADEHRQNLGAPRDMSPRHQSDPRDKEGASQIVLTLHSPEGSW